MSSFTNLTKTATSVYYQQGLASLIKAFYKYLSFKTPLFKIREGIEKKTLQTKYGNSAPHPYTIINVNPDRINMWSPSKRDGLLLEKSGIEFEVQETASVDTWFDAGLIKGGEWDNQQNLYHVNQSPKYNGVVEHFADGVPWEDTDYYDIILWLMDENKHFDGCRTQEEFDKRLGEIDKLYKKIEQEGYKKQSELCKKCNIKKYDEIGVSIGRDGQLIFQGGGWHRFAIASVLGINTIPVRVICRHREWQELRNHLARCDSYEKLHLGAKENLTHPDLRDVVPRSIINEYMGKNN
ncbi:hypothetical protein [Natronococcus pandeyae]|uniref:hypothetical protein n=1 Tax=Natronococcus pandeyae TaxID=2055836 RepID=UPI0011E7B3AB|nr:hypothetical protein [Natronococcus pandeyae]